ncbi:MAG: hypothetical protein IBX44_02300 [Sulfurospirillum sp.]|nr:hypothetical protein [Sulfurospirillum sp.]
MKQLFIIAFLLTFLNASKVPQLDLMISQMILTGFSGKVDGDKWIEQIKNDIEFSRISGVVVLERNIENQTQLKTLITSLKKSNKSSLPLFMAMNDTNNLALNETLANASLRYEKLANTLKDAGINLLFAPSFDLDGENEEIVLAYGSVFIDALHKAKIFSVAKHFPGVPNLWRFEAMKPYYSLIKHDKIDMIMPSQSVFEALDKDLVALHSQKIIRDILRIRMGYNGVIISDDMLSKTLQERHTLAQNITKAINSGVDILFFSSYFYNNSNIPKVVREIIYKAIQEGDLSEEQIARAYNRIKKLKEGL